MMGFFPLCGAKLKWWKCKAVPDIFTCSCSCSISDFFKIISWSSKWRSFPITKEIYELQRIPERTFNVNTAILVCCLWPSIYLFLHFYEIYYSAVFYQAFFFFFCLWKNACRSSLKDSFFLPSTNSLFAFYCKIYCLEEESCVIVL